MLRNIRLSFFSIVFLSIKGLRGSWVERSCSFTASLISVSSCSLACVRPRHSRYCRVAFSDAGHMSIGRLLQRLQTVPVLGIRRESAAQVTDDTLHLALA